MPMHALTTFLAGLLRGGRQPRHLFLAVVLGSTAGAVCGWNLTFAAIICLAALLNCSTSLLIGAAACGSLAAYLGASVCRSFGVLILDRCGVGEHLAKLGNGPFPALFGLDDYQTCGALAAGLALSIPAAQVFSRFAAHRRSLLNLTVAGNTAVREPLLRPLGFAAASCCAILAATGVQVQGPRLVGKSLLEHLSAALQTEVTADDVAYDLWSGDLRMTNLRVADAERPTDIALVVEQVSARVEPGLFLRGRFDCRDMTIAGLFCDPTKLSQAAPVGMFAKGPTLLKEDHPQPTHNEDPLRPVEIQGLVRNWSGAGDRLLVLQRLVTFVERISDLETATATNQALQPLVGRHRLQHDPISGASTPLVQVRNIKIDRLPSSWKLGPLSGLALTDLSSCPALAARPTKLTFHDAELRVTLETSFQLASPERKHAVALTAQDVELESLISTAATRNALEPLAGGTTAIEAQGWVTRELVRLDLSTTLSGLQVAKSSGPLAGIDAAVWRQGLARVGTLKLDAEVSGRWSNPKLSFVPHEFVQSYMKSLAAAGAKDVVLAFESKKVPTSTAIASHSLAATPTAPAAPAASPASTSLVPPAATAVMPKPNLLSGTFPSPAARTTAAYEPPTQPLTVQPMAMNPASIVTTNVVSPSLVLPHTPTASLLANPSVPPFLPTSPGFTPMTLTAKPVSAITTQPTTSAAPGMSSAVAASTAAIPTAPLKDLPSDKFNVVAGEPWKEPTVVLGAPAPTSGIATSSVAAPAASVAAVNTTAPLAPIGQPTTGAVANLATRTPSLEAAKPVESLKSTSSYPQEIASETSPAMGVPQPATLAKTPLVPSPTNPSASAVRSTDPSASVLTAKRPATVGPIPTSAEATAGLRQPLSVLDPNSIPGPINLTVGYDSERNSASSSGRDPAAASTASRLTNRPTAARGTPENEVGRSEPREERVAAARTTARPAPGPAVEEPSRERRLEPNEELTADDSPRPTRKPAKPPVADDARVAAQRNIEDLESEPESEPAPKRKSLISNVTGWFGAKSKEPAVEADDLRAETAPRDEESPEPKPAAKKMFPRIRALFGETPEMLPPDNARLPIDRNVVPSTAEESDSANKVRTSGFDAAAQEQVEAGNVPRALNIPRTNDADHGEVKPLAEARTFTEEKIVDADRAAAPSSASPRPARFTSAVNAEPAEPTAEKTVAQPTKTSSLGKTTPASRTAPKPTERLSAGESFYNRTVR